MAGGADLPAGAGPSSVGLVVAHSPPLKKRIPAAQQAALAAQREVDQRQQRGLTMWRSAENELDLIQLDTVHVLTMAEKLVERQDTPLAALADTIKKLQNQMALHRDLVLRFHEATMITGITIPQPILNLSLTSAQGQKLVLALARREAILQWKQESLAAGLSDEIENNTTETIRAEGLSVPKPTEGSASNEGPTPEWVRGANSTTLGPRRLSASLQLDHVPADWRRRSDRPLEDGPSRWMPPSPWRGEPNGEGSPELMLAHFRDAPADFYKSLPPPWDVVPDRPVRAQDAHRMAKAVEEFDGTPLHYTIWRAGFISMVHRCATEVDQKFRLLFKSFAPEARTDPRVAGLRRLPPTEDTYRLALETLEQEFGGPRRLLAVTMTKLKGLAPIKLYDTASMRAFRMHVSAYQQHCQQVEGQDALEGVTLFSVLSALFAPTANLKYRRYAVRERTQYNMQSLLQWVDDEIRENRDADLFTQDSEAAGQTQRKKTQWRAFQGHMGDAQRCDRDEWLDQLARRS